MTSPCAVWTIRVRPRGVSFVATTRTVSASMAASREAAATTRPSAFDTTLLVTTTMSPSASPAVASGHATARLASWMTAARSSPAVIGPMPSRATACTGGRVIARARTAAASARHSAAMAAVVATSVIIAGIARHRMPAASMPGTAAASAVSTSQASSTPPDDRAP